MKHLLIAGMLLAGSATISNAQQQSQVSAPAPHQAVTKKSFNEKAGQLTSLLNKNEAVGAKATMDDVSKMMVNVLNDTRSKMDDAAKAHNDADKNRYMELMMKQRRIYAATLKMRDDLIGNKTQVKEKLNEFEATML